MKRKKGEWKPQQHIRRESSLWQLVSRGEKGKGSLQIVVAVIEVVAILEVIVVAAVVVAYIVHLLLFFFLGCSQLSFHFRE